MGSLPVPEPREGVALQGALGFHEARLRGSHKPSKHEDGRQTIVLPHAGRDVSPVLLRQTAKDIGLSVEELPQAKS